MFVLIQWVSGKTLSVIENKDILSRNGKLIKVLWCGKSYDAEIIACNGK